MPNRITELGDEAFDDYEDQKKFRQEKSERNNARRALDSMAVTPDLCAEDGNVSGVERKLEALRNGGVVFCNGSQVNETSTMLGALGFLDIKVKADAHVEPGRLLVISNDALSIADEPLGHKHNIGECKVCERPAPLVDGECPNCRH